VQGLPFPHEREVVIIDRFRASIGEERAGGPLAHRPVMGLPLRSSVGRTESETRVLADTGR